MSLKLLPCDSPQCHALGAVLLSGEQYAVSSYVREVRCARCKRTAFLTMARFNALPEMRLEDFQDPRLATRDLEGAGFKRRQAEDLFRAGFDVHELDALERR